ncbi:MAM and LDL-receptor class A domain-containing protein 1 [Ixodes scapularis]
MLDPESPRMASDEPRKVDLTELAAYHRRNVESSLQEEYQVSTATRAAARSSTQFDEDGWYVAAVFPPGTWTVQKPAVLQRTTPGPFCFTGWYHVSGLRSPVLTFAATALTRRGVSYSTEDTVFLKADFSQTRLWQKVVYEEDRSGNVTIFISSSNALNSLVGLDDLSIVPGKCPPANHDGSCTFDYKDQCGYTSSSPKGSWHLKTRYLIPQKGMALDDHTTGTPVGGYMYHRVDAYKTTSAELTSPPLAKPAKPTRCLRFFYYAVRGSSGLEVSVEFQRGVSGLSNNFRNLRNVSKPVWSRYRTSLVPNRWYPAESSFSVEENHWVVLVVVLDAVLDAVLHVVLKAVLDLVLDVVLEVVLDVVLYVALQVVLEVILDVALGVVL